MSQIKSLLTYVLLVGILSGCHPKSLCLEPKISYKSTQRDIKVIPDSFKLSQKENNSLWGKEITLGQSFVQELDYYRSITCFKRAFFLIPPEEIAKKQQIEYAIFLNYYFAEKYTDALNFFNTSSYISNSNASFAPFPELLMALYHCFLQTEQEEKAEAVLEVIEKGNSKKADELQLFSAITNADFNKINTLDNSSFLKNFCRCKKSVRTAQRLNAFLPGAGYFYVGQKKTALTSLLINISFIGATAHFIKTGNIGAAVICLSLESGWYFGGINGAGLAAKQYNECIYQNMAKDKLIKDRLFPQMMIQTTF